MSLRDALLLFWFIGGVQYWIKYSRGPVVADIDSDERVSPRRAAAFFVCLPWMIVLHGACTVIAMAFHLWQSCRVLACGLGKTYLGSKHGAEWAADKFPDIREGEWRADGLPDDESEEAGPNA